MTVTISSGAELCIGITVGTEESGTGAGTAGGCRTVRTETGLSGTPAGGGDAGAAATTAGTPTTALQPGQAT